MATIIKTPIKRKRKRVEKELKKFAKENRNPDMATEKLFGIWEGRDISIEKIRENNYKSKWL